MDTMKSNINEMGSLQPGINWYYALKNNSYLSLFWTTIITKICSVYQVSLRHLMCENPNLFLIFGRNTLHLGKSKKHSHTPIVKCSEAIVGSFCVAAFNSFPLYLQIRFYFKQSLALPRWCLLEFVSPDLYTVSFSQVQLFHIPPPLQHFTLIFALSRLLTLKRN